ncbi:MAG: VOC family protein [Ginsengibacter sp.]|jgi:hypothetical protein
MQAKNPVIWFEIYVDDLKRAQTFYEKILNIEMSVLPTPDSLEEEMSMVAFPMEMDGPGAGGTLIKTESIKAGGNSTIIYFASNDCAIEEARIEAAGGKILQSKQSLGEFGFMVLAQDTEGNAIGIHSQK